MSLPEGLPRVFSSELKSKMSSVIWKIIPLCHAHLLIELMVSCLQPDAIAPNFALVFIRLAVFPSIIFK